YLPGFRFNHRFSNEQINHEKAKIMNLLDGSPDAEKNLLKKENPQKDNSDADQINSINHSQVIAKRTDWMLMTKLGNKWNSLNRLKKVGFGIGLPLMVFGIIALTTATMGWSAVAFLAILTIKLAISAALVNGAFGFLVTGAFTGITSLIMPCLPKTNNS